VNNDPNVALSQVLGCDAIYVPDLTRLDRLKPEALVKLATVLHDVYGSWELCHVVLAAHDRQCGTSYSQRYFERLARPPSGSGIKEALLATRTCCLNKLNYPNECES
jgi:hypothetical protein